MATGTDLALPGVDGRRTLMDRLMRHYVTRLHKAAAHDAALASSFIRVAGLVDRPPQLLRPQIALRVLRPARPRAAAATVVRRGLDVAPDAPPSAVGD